MLQFCGRREELAPVGLITSPQTEEKAPDLEKIRLTVKDVNKLMRASQLEALKSHLRSSRSGRNECVVVKVSTGQNGRSGNPNAVVLTESAKSGEGEASIAPIYSLIFSSSYLAKDKGAKSFEALGGGRGGSSSKALQWIPRRTREEKAGEKDLDGYKAAAVEGMRRKLH